MRYMRITNVQEGSVLGHDLFDTTGRMVMARGCILTRHYLDRLVEYGYSHLYIEDSISADIEIEPMISPTLRGDGMKCIADLDLDKAMSIARRIVEEILEKGITTLDMSDLRSFDDYTFGHSVNVAVLSCIIGISMDLNDYELSDLVLAGLLHDIGKLKIPTEILNKQGQLTKEEYQLMKTHPKQSYELLVDRTDISSKVKNAVLLHHENEDGSGYPTGMTGEELPRITKIIHVADIYDALVTDRAYKEGYSPFEAIEYLMGASGILVNREIVQAFIQVVPLHPKGTEVVLSNGETGIIVENSGVHNLRPVVRLVNSNTDLDLSERENMNITILEGAARKPEVLEREEKRSEMLRPIKTVLAVDDMETNLEILKDILKGDYNVKTFICGMDVLNYLENNEAPDLIIMDIDMPELNGIETTRRINNYYAKDHIPILFLTAICNRETVLTCRKLNAAGYIAKPFQNFYVRKEVDRIVKEWRIDC